MTNLWPILQSLLCPKRQLPVGCNFGRHKRHHLRLHSLGHPKALPLRVVFPANHMGVTGSHTSTGVYHRLSSPSFNGELLVIQRFNWEGFCMTKSLVWRSYAFMSFPMYLAGRSSACQPKLFLPGWDEILLQGGEGAHGHSQTKGSLQANSHQAGKMKGCHMFLGLDCGLHSHARPKRLLEMVK